MKIVVHPADRGGCGNYRLHWPARALGIESVYDKRYRLQMMSGRCGLPDTVQDVLNPPDCDIAVFQRTLTRQGYEFQRVLSRKGIKIVIDVDDDYNNLPTKHPEFRRAHPLRDPEYSWRWLERACEAADWVVVTTPALANIYGSHGRVSIVGNYIRRSWLDVRRDSEHDVPWIGWSGLTANHVDDLRVVGSAVAQLESAGLAEYHTVWDDPGMQEQLGVQRVHAPSPRHLDYQRRYAQLDIAIAPLQDNAFNRAKSWLKPLEAMALGVPVVASPRADYLRLADEASCAPFFAWDETEWLDLLGRLVSDHRLREDVGHLGREAIRKDYVLEDNAWRFREAWEACTK